MSSGGAVSTDRWEAFLSRFFGPPNSLGPAQAGSAELDAIVASAARSLTGDEPLPLLLPARIGEETQYVAIAFDRDQARMLRELLASHVGRTWTDFEGLSRLDAADLDELDAAAIDLAGGDPSCVFRFRVAPSARAEVRRAVRSLMDMLAARPPREARIRLPIGRVLGDFQDACAAGAEQAALVAHATLSADHRISAANRLFLRVQFLAAFEHWDELESMPGLQEVLRLDRPALASDALARLALRNLPASPTANEFGPVASRFGALVPSVGSIRSIAGARYYALWSFHAGEDSQTVEERLVAAGWAGTDFATLVATPGSPSSTLLPTSDDPIVLRPALLEALDSGLLDTAIDLLARLPATEADLAVVVGLVRRTLTASAIDLLNAYRHSLGADAVRAALDAADRVGDLPSLPLGLDVPAPDRIRALLLRDTDAALRQSHRAALVHSGVADLLVPGVLDAAMESVRVVTALPPIEIDTEDGLDTCLDLARDLRSSGMDIAGLGLFGLSLMELWGYHDQSGDRRRLRRIIQLVDDVLAAGLPAAAFEELVELLRAGWDPFLTDADLTVGLDAIELLLAYRPDGSGALDAFAVPLLARIGPHNVRRLPAAALEVAAELAPLFGMQVSVPVEDVAVDPDSDLPKVPPGTVVALYSLMEQAAERAAGILRRRHPGLGVVILADHVASDRLRSIARSADLLVVVDRAAKHAATEAMKAARGSGLTRYAAGKGATSLIEAAEAGIRDLASVRAA